MLHELWEDKPGEDDPGGWWTFCLAGPRGNDARRDLTPRARLVWTVEATSYFDAMTRYYEHQGWGTYTTIHEWDRRTYAEHGWE